MRRTNHAANLGRILKTLDAESLALSAREGSALEFKETFNWAAKDKYAKTMAAFANNRGGYLVFGVVNSPRKLAGLQTNNFDSLDEATITAYLNGTFFPEIHYEKFSFSVDVAGKQIGVLYTHKSEEGPIVPIKNDGVIREAEIYYRYNARNDKIKYPELMHLFELAQERERRHWMELFERVSRIGPANAGIMDMVRGTIEGNCGSLVIDASLLPKLRFLREGMFANTGKPILKLVGDVRPVVAAGPFKEGNTAIRLTSDPTAPMVREESILDQFPMSYKTLVKTLKRRYSNFKQDTKFHTLKRKLSNDTSICKRRLLDPSKPKGTSKAFYSPKIIDEFDRQYAIRC